MANDAWGQLGWNVGNFGQQNNITVPVTSVVDNPIAWNQSLFGNGNWGGQFNNIPISLSDETVIAEVTIGWGSDGWGIENWGESGTSVVPSGNALSLNINQGWGSLSWNSSEISWGGDTVINVAIGQQIDVTGLQLNTSLNSVTEIITVDAFVTTAGLLETSLGELDIGPDANVTGEQLNLSIGSVQAYNRQGWGRYYWGEEAWGGDGIWETVTLNNNNLDLTINSGITEYWGQDEWGASTTEWGGSSITQVNIDVTVEVSSIVDAGWGQVAWGTQGWGQGQLTTNLNIAEGEVDPGPDVAITGQQINLSLNQVNITGDSNLDLTGQQLNLSLNSVTADANTIPTITGLELTSSVGTVFAGGNTDVNVTGNLLTVALNSINNQIWTEVNTGTDATWIEIDTAA